MNAIDRLAELFTETLRLPAGTNVSTLEYRGVEQWDSVAHMQLVSEIENTFDVMLQTEDVIAMGSFTKARDILRKHGVDT
jgi:acyl carrier protein